MRLGEVKQGDQVVVLGGGPIGMLVALVAKASGAQVLVSEINPFDSASEAPAMCSIQVISGTNLTYERKKHTITAVTNTIRK